MGERPIHYDRARGPRSDRWVELSIRIYMSFIRIVFSLLYMRVLPGRNDRTQALWR